MGGHTYDKKKETAGMTGGGREKRGGRGGEKELRGYVLARIERWRVSEIARGESRELHRCGGAGGVFGIGRIRAQRSERRGAGAGCGDKWLEVKEIEWELE